MKSGLPCTVGGLGGSSLDDMVKVMVPTSLSSISLFEHYALLLDVYLADSRKQLMDVTSAQAGSDREALEATRCNW